MFCYKKKKKKRCIYDCFSIDLYFWNTTTTSTFFFSHSHSHSHSHSLKSFSMIEWTDRRKIEKTIHWGAGKVFVEFEKVSEATKAHNDLGGRAFTGRLVMSGYYSEERYRFKLHSFWILNFDFEFWILILNFDLILIWIDLIWLIWFELIRFDWFDWFDLIDLIWFDWFDWFDLIWFDWFDWFDLS